MKLDWQRVKRTAIQAAIGAAIILLETLVAGFTTETLINALEQAAYTVVIAVLMNLDKQTKDGDTDDT